MINQVVDQLKAFRDHIDQEFSEWFTFAVEMGEKVGVGPSTPRLAPCWSRFRNNVPNDSPCDYFKKAIGIPVIDSLVNHLVEQMKDRQLVELFAILPSIITNDNIDKPAHLANESYALFVDDIEGNKTAFSHEIKQWRQFCVTKSANNAKQDLRCKSSNGPNPNNKRRRDQSLKGKRVDGKTAFTLTEAPDGFIDSLNFAD